MLKEGSFFGDSPFLGKNLLIFAVFNKLPLIVADLDINWSRWVPSVLIKQKHKKFFKSIVGSLNSQAALRCLGFANCCLICLLLSFIFIHIGLNQRKQHNSSLLHQPLSNPKTAWNSSYCRSRKLSQIGWQQLPTKNEPNSFKCDYRALHKRPI